MFSWRRCPLWSDQLIGCDSFSPNASFCPPGLLTAAARRNAPQRETGSHCPSSINNKWSNRRCHSYWWPIISCHQSHKARRWNSLLHVWWTCGNCSMKFFLGRKWLWLIFQEIWKSRLWWAAGSISFVWHKTLFRFLQTKDEQSQRWDVFRGEETFRSPLTNHHVKKMNTLWYYTVSDLTEQSKIVYELMVKHVSVWGEMKLLMFLLGQYGCSCAEHQLVWESDKSYQAFLW